MKGTPYRVSLASMACLTLVALTAESAGPITKGGIVHPKGPTISQAWAKMYLAPEPNAPIEAQNIYGLSLTRETVRMLADPVYPSANFAPIVKATNPDNIYPYPEFVFMTVTHKSLEYPDPAGTAVWAKIEAQFQTRTFIPASGLGAGTAYVIYIEEDKDGDGTFCDAGDGESCGYLDQTYYLPWAFASTADYNWGTSKVTHYFRTRAQTNRVNLILIPYHDATSPNAGSIMYNLGILSMATGTAGAPPCP